MGGVKDGDRSGISMSGSEGEVLVLIVGLYGCLVWGFGVGGRWRGGEEVESVDCEGMCELVYV